MILLIDTNVICELARPTPDAIVFGYVQTRPATTLFTSVICEAEVRYGLARLPPGRRRDDLTARLSALFQRSFDGKILSFGSACAAACADIRAAREAEGRPIEVEGAMIAATAAVHGAVLVTRNPAHFEGCGVRLVNPWQAIPP